MAESLRAVLEDVLSPYPAQSEGRLKIDGEDFRLDDRGATPIALLIHELATNATKYGALSVENGTVVLTISRDNDVAQIEWLERGGPILTGEPDHEGFGTKLAELSIVNQLGGTLDQKLGSGRFRRDRTGSDPNLAR